MPHAVHVSSVLFYVKVLRPKQQRNHVAPLSSRPRPRWLILVAWKRKPRGISAGMISLKRVAIISHDGRRLRRLVKIACDAKRETITANYRENEATVRIQRDLYTHRCRRSNVQHIQHESADTTNVYILIRYSGWVRSSLQPTVCCCSIACTSVAD